MAANKCFAEVTFAKATSCHLFLPCLLILSRSLAERRPQRPPTLLHADPKLANAPIRLFPPPPSKIFRCLSVRESLLCGLLAADLVGFQAMSYARHFHH